MTSNITRIENFETPKKNCKLGLCCQCPAHRVRVHVCMVSGACLVLLLALQAIHIWNIFGFSSGCQFLRDKLGPIQRKVTRIMKGLKIMSSQGVLKEPGLFSLGEKRLSGRFESCFQTTSHEKRSRFALCTSRAEKRLRIEARRRERSAFCKGNIFICHWGLKNLWVTHIVGGRKSCFSTLGHYCHF